MATGISKTNVTANPWLYVPRPNPSARLRLFCFPYAGGGAMIYRKWAEGLPPTVEVCAIRLPGRESRLKEPPFSKITTLVEALDGAVEPHLSDKPFAFFGHSMGAIIAYTLTNRLRERGLAQPVHLFVSGRTAPHIADDDPPTYNLPEPEFIEDLRRLNGTPKEVLENPELMKVMLSILRADFEVCQTYVHQPQPPLDCPITAFGGLQDPGVTREKLEGWREHTTATFTLRMLPGDHFFLNSAQPLLLRTLAVALHQTVQALP